jgi:hypothetical protein
MDLLTRADLRPLLAGPREVCVSLFQPTHRGGSEQDPVRWKNLLREANDRLTTLGLRAPAARDLLTPARALLEDGTFWTHQSDGLAAFLAPGFFRSYRLPAAFPERAVVGRHFHLKPVLPLVIRNCRFYVLAISQKQVRLLQGTEHGVHEVALDKVPQGLAEALRFTEKEEPLLFHTRPAGGGASWGAIFHGHGVGIDDHKADLLDYFRQVDRGLHEVLREERAPMVLAGVEYLWPIYREANRYPHLLEEGVPGSPDRLSGRELHDRAWAVVAPHFRQAHAKAAALYGQLAGTGLTSDDLEEVVRAAHAGRVELLFVARDRERWGTFDPAGGAVAVHDREEPGDEGLLNLAALYTVLHGGDVYVVGPDEVPGGAPQAALFWLPPARRAR